MTDSPLLCVCWDHQPAFELLPSLARELAISPSLARAAAPRTRYNAKIHRHVRKIVQATSQQHNIFLCVLGHGPLHHLRHRRATLAAAT